MKKFAGLFAAAFVSLYAGAAFSAACNTPSGFVKLYGEWSLGDLLVLGPDCNTAVSGGPASGGTVSSFNGRTGAVVPAIDDYGAAKISFTQTGSSFPTHVNETLQAILTVKQFGAKGDGKFLTDGGISGGSSTFSSATAAFASTDCTGGTGCTGTVNKVIRIVGAGAAGATLSTTISGFTNSTIVTLAASATTTVSGAQVVYGTDDTAAIQAGLNRAQAASTTSASLYLPNGLYITTSALSITTAMHFYGDGLGNSFIFPALNSNGISVNTNSSVTLERFQIFYISAASPTFGILVDGPGAGGNTDSTIREIQILNPYIGIATINAKLLTIADNKIFTMGLIGIQLASVALPDSGNNLIRGNFIQDNTFTKIGIQWTSGGGTKIINNYILNSLRAVDISLLTGAVTGMLTIAENNFDGAAAYAVYVARQGTTGSFRNLLVNSNQCNLAKACVYIPTDATGKWLTNVNITSNIWNDDGTAGAFAFVVNSTNNCTIANNSSQATANLPTNITTGASTDWCVVGPNGKIGSFTASVISSTNTTTIAPN